MAPILKNGAINLNTDVGFVDFANDRYSVWSSILLNNLDCSFDAEYLANAIMIGNYGLIESSDKFLNQPFKSIVIGNENVTATSNDKQVNLAFNLTIGNEGGVKIYDIYNSMSMGFQMMNGGDVWLNSHSYAFCNTNYDGPSYDNAVCSGAVVACNSYTLRSSPKSIVLCNNNAINSYASIVCTNSASNPHITFYSNINQSKVVNNRFGGEQQSIAFSAEKSLLTNNMFVGGDPEIKTSVLVNNLINLKAVNNKTIKNSTLIQSDVNRAITDSVCINYSTDSNLSERYGAKTDARVCKINVNEHAGTQGNYYRDVSDSLLYACDLTGDCNFDLRCILTILSF